MMPHSQPTPSRQTGLGSFTPGTYGSTPCLFFQSRWADSAALRARSNDQLAGFPLGSSNCWVVIWRAASLISTSS
nr:hypothetical protein [Lentzea aerocolonigenes]